jgi:serine/threonine protein kinase/beta-lactam-binding protein with PASTA domain
VSSNQRVIAGRYEVGNLIGRGGMADVYEGVDTRLGRTVAIKLLKADLANDPNFEARFRQEAQASARMAHPTIVRVYDAGEDVTVDSNGNTNRHPFIVMEYVNGKLLRDLLHERRLTLQEAIDFETGVLTALEFSHRAGIVHRDIKSANVMITETGQVKVMDFGIARAVSENSATVAHTSGIVGTAQYFSPEQAKGESVDARTDLYSAGVLLYEMLAGRPPFKGESAVSVAYQHVSEAVVPPSEFDSNVSPEMDAVVLRALAKDRNERFQSAEEFREHLLAAYAVVLENTTDELPAHALAFEPEPEVETPSIDLPVEEVPTDVFTTGLDEFDALLASAGAELVAEPAAEVPATEAPAAHEIAAEVAPAQTFEPEANKTEVFKNDVFNTESFNTESFETEGPSTNPFAELGVELPTAAQPTIKYIPTGKPKSSLLWSIGSGVGVVLIGLMVWLFTLNGFNLNITPGSTGISVADVTNKTYDEGYNTLTAQHLLVTKVYEASETIPLDTIIHTDPTAGTKVPDNTTITVYVSSGKTTVKVPGTLIGMTESEATAALMAAQLTLGTITQANSATVAAGKVIETDPIANADVAQGSVVNLVISNGQVNVPDVRNLSTSDAQSKMSSPEVGLTVSIAVQGGTCPAGKTQGTIIVEQSILPGLAPQGSAIILYVGCN